MIQTISSTVFKSENLQVKFSINISEDAKYNHYTKFESPSGIFETLDLKPSLSLRYMKKDVTYRPEHTIRVTPVNIYYINSRFKLFYNTLMSKKDIFIYYKSGTIEYTGTEKDKLLLDIKGKDFIELEPAVITDQYNNVLPGIKMRINGKDNEVSLSMDEYETLLYIFDNINFIGDGFSLYNIHLLKQERKSDSEKTVEVREKPKNIFDVVEERRNNVQDNTLRIKTITSLEDLEG